MKIVPIAKALLIDDAKHVLILRRSSTNPTKAGWADLPGGLIEPGEEPGDAVRREVAEEVGLRIPREKFELIYAGAEMHNDENRIRLLYVVYLEETQPAVTLSFEHDGAQWRPLADIKAIETELDTFYKGALKYIDENRLLGV